MPVNTTPFNSSTFSTPPVSVETDGGQSFTTTGNPTTLPPNYADGNTVLPNPGESQIPPIITQQKFLGATVVSFTNNAAYNEQSSTMTVYLVEDKRTNDDFLLKEDNIANANGKMIGTPVSFVMGGFRFDGLILGFQQDNSFQGNPLYEVTLVSPVTILEGTQVILSNYIGPVNDSIFNGETRPSTFHLSNILNVYGYLEDGGQNFGGSLSNETGLLWEGPQGIKHVIEVLTNTNQNSYAEERDNFGSYLFYRDHAYRLDFSALPIAPSFYRLGGTTNMSLLEIVTSICESAGVYYLVCLQIGQGNGPHTIYFKVANLTSSANLNTIGQFIASQEVSNSHVGQELRSSDFTQAMILGGEICTLYPQQNWSANDPSVIPFWGFDVNGLPITGSTPTGSFFADDNHAMNLNASEIADVMGAIGLGPYYPCTVLELRFALTDYDSWAAFLYSYKKGFAEALGIYSASNVDLGELGLYMPQFVQDFVNDSVELATQLGEMNDNTQWTSISQRVYEYVRNQAETYYGKQFLVKLPFQLQFKVTPESTQVTYSDEPTDAGFIPELSYPLNLNYINENFFLTPDGRMSPFFRFQFNSLFNSVGGPKLLSVNTSTLDNSAVIQYDQNINNSYVYMPYGEPENSPVMQGGILGGGNIIFVTGAAGIPVPAIVCTITSAIFAQAEDPLGGISDIASMLGVSTQAVSNAASFRSDSFPVRINPAAFYPNGVAVAMKSNRYTYGPWGKFVANGRVYFEQDSSLTPWEYGGFDNLTQGAIAKLATIQAGNQVKERGSLYQPGMPKASLGDVLIAGGPNISNIEVTVDPDQGVTTTYTMETYVPRIGRFNDENASRLKRYGQLAQTMRRAIRQLVLEKGKKQQIINANVKGFMQGASYAVQQKTPHAVMGGHLVYDSGSKSFYPMAYMETYRESVANINAHNDDYFQRSACIGLDGVFRAVSTNVNSSVLPHYQPIRANILSATPVTNSGIQPIRPNSDFYWFTHGDTYSHLNNKREKADMSNTRLMALRGPLVVSSWCYDIQGRPIPNAAASGTDLLQKYSNSFKSGYLTHSQDWPVGAVALHYDQMRGVFTIPTMMMGWISGAPIPAYGTGIMAITFGNGVSTGDTITVTSFYAAPVNSGVRAQAMYYQLDNKYYITSVGCG